MPAQHEAERTKKLLIFLTSSLESFSTWGSESSISSAMNGMVSGSNTRNLRNSCYQLTAETKHRKTMDQRHRELTLLQGGYRIPWCMKENRIEQEVVCRGYSTKFDGLMVSIKTAVELKSRLLRVKLPQCRHRLLIHPRTAPTVCKALRTEKKKMVRS